MKQDKCVIKKLIKFIVSCQEQYAVCFVTLQKDIISTTEFVLGSKLLYIVN